MKLICVPLSYEAMSRLDLDENLEEDLVELSIHQEDYEMLESSGYFDQLNKQLNLMIEEYEDEKILYDYLPIALDITNNFSLKHKDKLWFDLKELISLAIKSHTGIFFFF